MKVKIIKDTMNNPLSTWIVGLIVDVKKSKTVTGATCYYETTGKINFPLFREEFVYEK